MRQLRTKAGVTMTVWISWCPGVPLATVVTRTENMISFRLDPRIVLDKDVYWQDAVLQQYNIKGTYGLKII